MQLWQQAKSSPIRSFLLIFQFFEAISNNQPSGIKPSKKGNNRFSVRPARYGHCQRDGHVGCSLMYFASY
jgi:hypothetical protein